MAVRHVQDELEVSERRACSTLIQPRATQRYQISKPDKDKELIKQMREISKKNPRYGYRRVREILERQGFSVNRKRVYRLWKSEGLKVRVKQRKRRRSGTSSNACFHRRAEGANCVWSYDFVMDQTADGRRLKMLVIVDEFTRESLRITVERSITARGVIEALQILFAERGKPQFIRSDNGPEFIADAVKKWLSGNTVDTLFIEPGSPWENAYSETFNSRFGDECLKREEFSSLMEAKVLVEQYRKRYNEERPHSSLKYQTPAEFARAQIQKLDRAQSTAQNSAGSKCKFPPAEEVCGGLSATANCVR